MTARDDSTAIALPASPEHLPGKEDKARPGATSGAQFLTTPQKAALIIAVLGPESAGPIIERIEDKHLRAFARAYAHLQTVPKGAIEGVVKEFVGRLSKNDEEIKGGYEETRELLSQFIGSDDIIRLMDDIDIPGGESIWERLERAPDAALAEYLGKQSPQLIAVVLSKLNAEQASRLLDLLDTELARDTILRLSKPIQIKREALQVLSDTIERDFLNPLRQETRTRNPGEMIGAMMNNITSEKREELLTFISSKTPDIMRDVKKSMLTFQDIPERVPGKAISLVIKEMELSDFLQAAKFGKQNAPSSVEYIFSNISQRMAQQYEEEMETLKKIPVKNAERAQAAFMAIVRKLVAAGEIELMDIPSDEDEDLSE